MSKDELVKLIKERVRTEYDKYHNTPVDFIESAALKIVAAISFEESNTQSKLSELERENKELKDGIEYVIEHCANGTEYVYDELNKVLTNNTNK